MRLDLGHRVHGDAHDDQDRRSAKIEGRLVERDEGLRQKANEGDVGGADDGQAREDIIQIGRRALAR